MTVYMTKVWGFSVPSGPLQFGASGRRETARQQLKPGDLVVLVGTKGSETSPDKRGRVLGLLEPTTEVVSSLDFDLRKREIDFDEEGKYRWPYALLIRRAWEFDQPYRLFEDVSSRQFSMDAASGIVPLTNDEAARILEMPRTPAQILAPVRARARTEGELIARRLGAPPPTTTRRGVMHMRRAPAYTYAMAIGPGELRLFKIGWAFDFRARERGFNQTSLPKLGGLEYKSKLYHLWDTAMQAFEMEQALLRRFGAMRHAQNQEVICAEHKSVESAWYDYLAKMRRPR